MIFGKKKPLTDSQRLSLAIKNLEELKAKSKDDPWGFIGSVVLMYHSMRQGSIVAGQYETFELYERNLLATIQLGSPARKDGPYG